MFPVLNCGIKRDVFRIYWKEMYSEFTDALSMCMENPEVGVYMWSLKGLFENFKPKDWAIFFDWFIEKEKERAKTKQRLKASNHANLIQPNVTL